MHARQHLDFVILLAEHVGLGLEGLVVRVIPPAVHITLLVEEPALVVEAVGHLVADHHADGAIVDCVVSVGVEERRLEYGCREADFVGGRVVIGIDGLRGHMPFARIGRLAELVEILGCPPAP